MATLLFLQNLEYECLGPMYLASALRQHGHEARLAMGQTLADFDSDLKHFQPEVVAFSVTSGNHAWARQMGVAIKRRHATTILWGGPHPTLLAEAIQEPGVDVICRGEGEAAVVDLMDRIAAGRDFADIANLTVVRDGKVHENPVRHLPADADGYAFPDRSLYDRYAGRLDRSVPAVITSRGCPFQCTFCCAEALRTLYAGKGKYVRLRSVDNVLEECRRLKANGETRTINFADDVFGLDRAWLYDFLPRYRREVGLPFVCMVRADIVAADEHYATRLAEGGCVGAFFGLESGRESLRNRLLDKSLSDAQVRRAADLLHRAGLPFRTYNMVALPGETLDDALSTVQMNIDIKTDYPWCSIYTPYPATALARHAADGGYLATDAAPADLQPSFFVSSSLTNMADLGARENLQKLFQTAVRWPWTFGLVKRLIHLPPNRFFDWWFGLVYFYIYLRSERRDFWKTLRSGLRNFHRVLFRPSARNCR